MFISVALLRICSGVETYHDVDSVLLQVSHLQQLNEYQGEKTMKPWNTLRGGGCHHWSILWIFTSCCFAVPDPDAFHPLSKDEFDSFMRELHPARAPRYDTELARSRRQAGVETYEYDSDEPESGDWEDWGPPSPCSRYKHFTICKARF